MKPETKDKPEFTWKNWWYYNKWLVLGGILIAVAAAGVIVNNLTRVKPDYQMAYIGNYPLPAETVSAVEAALSSYGSDLNGDGKVVFRLNQYRTAKNADPEIALGQVGWETQLMADLLDCESYFFLLENAEDFNRDYDILSDEMVPVKEIGALSGIEAIKDMELSRRIFEGGKTVKHKDGCEALWNNINEKH